MSRIDKAFRKMNNPRPFRRTLGLGATVVGAIFGVGIFGK